jgi:hypothetical protein
MFTDRWFVIDQGFCYQALCCVELQDIGSSKAGGFEESASTYWANESLAPLLTHRQIHMDKWSQRAPKTPEVALE